MQNPQKLKLILGDQLNIQHSWFSKNNPESVYVMMEVKEETTYVKHHIQKIVAFFLAMRQFAQELVKRGHEVIYYKFDDPENFGSFEENLTQIINNKNIFMFEYQQPDEYRVQKNIEKWLSTVKIEYKKYETEHFLITPQEFSSIFKGKNYLMENFYRKMRKKHHILMNGEEPIGGQWNFDKENRNKFDAKTPIPKVGKYDHPEIFEIINSIKNSKIETIGEIDATNFIWPTNRTEALELINEFIEVKLPFFGKYQDSLYDKHEFMFHSRISFAMNVKLI
ncbi:MAG: cryptochrome/photolyase family protein, partial [Cytophagales bacterium]